MSLFLESGYTSLNKINEELCGDRVECVSRDGYTTMVLADGLGSGVKANILATLTSKILCTMVSNNIDIKDCIETIIQSLPVCKVRGVAYATFSVVHIDENGEGYLFEFDNPQAIYIHNNKCGDLTRTEMDILGKRVYKSKLRLSKNDFIVMMSDGTIHAGIGKTLNFGWQRNEIKEFLDNIIDENCSARNVACSLASACNDLYMDKPGDDTTVAAIKVREHLPVSLMVGPPVKRENDDFYVEQFLKTGEKKVVCGGTSSQIVARYLKTEVSTSLDFPDKDVPPIGFIDGIDLTTEGVLTLRKLLELSENYLSPSDLSPKRKNGRDGASLLSNILFEDATDVTFFVGQAMNSAHQNLPIDITMKLKLVDSLSNNLKMMGKNVTVYYN